MRYSDRTGAWLAARHQLDQTSAPAGEQRHARADALGSARVVGLQRRAAEAQPNNA
jgi:hypothetical protein